MPSLRHSVELVFLRNYGRISHVYLLSSIHFVAIFEIFSIRKNDAFYGRLESVLTPCFLTFRCRVTLVVLLDPLHDNTDRRDTMQWRKNDFARKIHPLL